MSHRSRRIAVLGAGIMGSSTALYLARRGARVTLFDRLGEPMSSASRWNEGKIHLGFLYSGDPTLRTAAHILPGGLQFKPLVEDLLGCRLDAAKTAAHDLFLCHRDSVVPPDATQSYFERVAELVRQHPDAKHYLADVSACDIDCLTPGEIRAVSDSPDIVAGFRVPEHSVSTSWVADRYADALAGERNIELRMGARIVAVRPEIKGDLEARWQVFTEDSYREPFDLIVNALWANRLEIDTTAGMEPSGIRSNRYRLSLFVRTSRPVAIPCATIVTGPFGDIKNYNDRDFYLSWYPDGLRVTSTALSPPDPTPLDEPAERELSHSIMDHLEALLSGVQQIRPHIEQAELRGGWVFAAGQGQLSDPEATLHRRSTFGIASLGSYISVDTGKYSTAPWLARRLADQIV